MKVFTYPGILCLCLFLSSCNLPVLFWEEEARKVVDDVVDEEKKKIHSSQY